MSFNFNVKFNNSAENAIAKAKNAVSNGGGSFNGDNNSGDFSGNTPLGKVVGNYRVISDSEATITITSKPFLLGEGLVKTEVAKFFA